MLSVALCTYNGEKYLSEQLDSIAKQTCLPDELVVSDDHSTDKTMNILEKFAQIAPFPVKILTHEGTPRGSTKNFSVAIEACRGEYIALADQDDVWCSSKLNQSMKYMKQLEGIKKEAALIYTDLYVCNEYLKLVGNSLIKMQGFCEIRNPIDILKLLLVQNFVTGCTILINASLKKKVCPIPDGIVMHDWWLALYAAAYGNIFFINEPLVFYRQHKKNQIGAQKYNSWRAIWKKWYALDVLRRMEKSIYQIIILKRCILDSVLYSDIIDLYLKCLIEGKWYKLIAFNMNGCGFLRKIVFSWSYIFYQKEFQRFLYKHKI